MKYHSALLKIFYRPTPVGTNQTKCDRISLRNMVINPHYRYEIISWANSNQRLRYYMHANKMLLSIHLDLHGQVINAITQRRNVGILTVTVWCI